jgi:hypothetical protein
MGLFEVIDAWDLVLFLKVTFFFGLGVVFFFFCGENTDFFVGLVFPALNM